MHFEGGVNVKGEKIFCSYLFIPVRILSGSFPSATDGRTIVSAGQRRV